MRWILREPGTPESSADLPGPPGSDGIPRLIRHLLNLRRLGDPLALSRYLEPSLDDLTPADLLPDLSAAADRLDRALTASEPIFIFGDYDVDGMTSAALLRRALTRLGGRLRVRIPDRLREGYGLSSAVVEEASDWGARLLVTADCGTTAVEPIRRARELGIDAIVADHHLPESEMPPAVAVVNPWRADFHPPFRDLAAVGVVTRIVEGLWRLRRRRGEESPSPFDLLDLTALGTIADSVRLDGDNRVLVHHGLRILRENPRPAMRALMRSCGIPPERIGSGEIAFRLAPRLNAAGRLGDAPTALALLLGEEEDRCGELASVLDRHNRERQALLERVVREATDLAEREGAPARGEAIVFESGDWHLGVLGIAAARLADRFGVPTILLTRDGEMLRGSGRTAGLWDLLILLRGCSGCLRSLGGHRAAVGLSLDAKNLGSLRECLASRMRDSGTPVVPTEKIQWIDARAEIGEIDLPLLDWIDRLGPFGQGNHEPVFALRGRIAGPVRILKERHLRFDLLDRGGMLECIGFGMADRADLLVGTPAEVHVAATPTRNLFRGEERVQLQLREIARGDPFGHD